MKRTIQDIVEAMAPIAGRRILYDVAESGRYLTVILSVDALDPGVDIQTVSVLLKREGDWGWGRCSSVLWSGRSELVLKMALARNRYVPELVHATLLRTFPDESFATRTSWDNSGRTYEIGIMVRGTWISLSIAESRMVCLRERLCEAVTTQILLNEPIDLAAQYRQLPNLGVGNIPSRTQLKMHSALHEDDTPISKIKDVPSAKPKLTIYCEGDDW